MPATAMPASAAAVRAAPASRQAAQAAYQAVLLLWLRLVGVWLVSSRQVSDRLGRRGASGARAALLFPQPQPDTLLLLLPPPLLLGFAAVLEHDHLSALSLVPQWWLEQHLERAPARDCEVFAGNGEPRGVLQKLGGAEGRRSGWYTGVEGAG